jgi:histidine triad (HIT) family protein
MAETIFSKIIRKEIPADIVFENDNVLAFRDIRPQAPTHILIIPKIDDISKTLDIDGVKHSVLLGKLIDAANEIAKKEKISESGFRLVINCGPDAGQEVYHLHMHLLGGRKMNWPPG